MTKAGDLPTLGDEDLMLLLGTKRQTSSWTVGELREVQRRGMDFLSADPELRDMLEKANRDFIGNLAAAVSPSLESLRANHSSASSFANDILKLNNEVSEAFKNLQTNAASEALKAMKSNAASEALKSVQAKLNFATELSQSTKRALGLNIAPKFLSTNFAVLESMNRMAKLANTYQLPKYLTQPSPALEGLAQMAKLVKKESLPVSVSQENSVLGYLEKNSVAAEKLTEALEISERQAISSISESDKLGTNDAVLDLPINSPETILEIATPIIAKVESEQEMALSKLSFEFYNNTEVATGHLADISKTLRDGSVPRWAIWVSVICTVIAAATGIATAIKVLWFTH